jgi:hypothetical protein
MIAVQVRNKDMVDFGKLEFVFTELYLSAFTAIDEKHAVPDFQYLCCGISNGSWRGCIATQ